MIINEKTFYKMPEKLQKLFDKLPNLSKEEVVAGFPETNPSKDGGTSGTTFATGALRTDLRNGHTDNGGSASRFFYTAKAHSSERNYGLEGFEETYKNGCYGDGTGNTPKINGIRPTGKSNHHPTVKPLDLMQYLVRLVTPKGGVCLDAFMGSGTTGMACKLEHFDFIGIELETEYFKIAKARIDAVGEVTEVKLDNGKLF